MDKIRVGIVTSPVFIKTGFSCNAKILLSYLYKTGKYELIHLNTGTDFNDPNLQKTPWKNEGIFNRPNSNIDMQRVRNDPEYQRLATYGNLTIENFVIDNKLDCIILIEDGWAFVRDFYYLSPWYKHLKENVLLWTTCDSVPVLDLFKDWAQNCPNVLFWSSFGVKALKKEDPIKYKHIDYLFGTLDIDKWKPITKLRKKELRQKFHIDEDCKLFIKVNRNQLRKLYLSVLDGFARFKKENPNQKAKLFFHCNWVEPGGWPLQKAIINSGLNREDVLTTYYCKNCKAWEVKYYDGEDIDCPNCKSQKSRITAGVTSPITDQELSELYGMCDAGLSCFDSGGLEYMTIQSLLCGLPTLCSDYSCGEDFCEQDFVFKLDGTFGYQHGTGFKKFIPNINTLVKFFKKICESPEEKLKEIGQKGRNWAFKTFHPNTICPKIESWIDSRKKIEWDYKYTPSTKNPNAVINASLNNEEWVTELYNKILDCNPDPQGFAYWIQTLQHGMPRAKIEEFFRNKAREEYKPQTQNTFEDQLINNGKKQFLITIPESVGDCLYVSSLLRSFRESYPSDEWNLYLATKQEYVSIFDGDPYLDKVLVYQPFMDHEILMTGQGQMKGIFDGYCFVSVLTQKFLSYLTNNKVPIDLTYK